MVNVQTMIKIFSIFLWFSDTPNFDLPGKILRQKITKKVSHSLHKFRNYKIEMRGLQDTPLNTVELYKDHLFLLRRLSGSQRFFFCMNQIIFLWGQRSGFLEMEKSSRFLGFCFKELQCTVGHKIILLLYGILIDSICTNFFQNWVVFMLKISLLLFVFTKS